jgi:UDP-N-acetylglucosamine/UDP-N-acetyl-alpha-D-glucosaminouronate 4-epimerase
MSAYQTLKDALACEPKSWLITGVAGFIGSHLLEALLKLEQNVVGLDNFVTGFRQNLEQVHDSVGERCWARFRMLEGDILDFELCRRACQGANFVLHHAALGSVPRSLADPRATHDSNVSGFLNVLLAAREARVKRFVFASSSAVYGDAPGLPNVEETIGRPLSPYAATKMMNETYASLFARSFNFTSVALRYFNIFGPRQDPEGAYAAVIPKWIEAMLNQQPVYINGDGETSRDFCYIEDVVQANLLAATSENPDALGQAYNISVGRRTTLNELFKILQHHLVANDLTSPGQKPIYREFRAGDVRHSLADIGKARRLLGYAPEYRIEKGLALHLEWYRQRSRRGAALGKNATN